MKDARRGRTLEEYADAGVCDRDVEQPVAIQISGVWPPQPTAAIEYSIISLANPIVKYRESQMQAPEGQIILCEEMLRKI